MEVYLYNSTVCRLCGEENDNGSLLYASEENIQNLSEFINKYLPLKVSDDGLLPRTICPGCTIQLEATVEFLNLITNGQKVIRELLQREKDYKKTILSSTTNEDIVTDNLIVEVSTSNGMYQEDHPIALQVAGLERPKRKRGRPPKKPKSAEEIALEAIIREEQMKAKQRVYSDDLSGKRRRKMPTRFREVVQGKELEKIFKEEGVSDGESGLLDDIEEPESKSMGNKQPEIIGHKQDSGELVVVVKGKGRGRPKGRIGPTHETCDICGMEFSCVGRYMSHLARHGPVTYQCAECNETFSTRLEFNNHQQEMSHTGRNIISEGANLETLDMKVNLEVEISTLKSDEEKKKINNSKNNEETTNSMPDLNPPSIEINPGGTDVVTSEESSQISTAVDSKSTEDEELNETTDMKHENTENKPKKKEKLKCNHCDKVFSSKQSKSLHTRATHQGERPFVCLECGARFGYPRSLALHKLSHRRTRKPAAGYACDLCGKVLNHPSSVVYHKEAEHAGQRYVCNKCGKSFKHKQILQRHQLVHTQVRPFNCKICGASFKTKANLLNHQLLHSGVKRYSCELCNHKFAHKTSLTLHMRWHTGQKPYACKICGKSFSQKGNLSEHERIHTGEKPYACILCPRRFTTSSQHRQHHRRHLADRPYACDTCSKRFATPAARAAHSRREAGCRSHRCGDCGRAFPERWALLKHMRRHTGERPFRCPHCPRAFADCSNLNKHKKQVHKQVSLLASSNQPHTGIESSSLIIPDAEPITVLQRSDVGNGNCDEPEERIIYVAYDVDDDTAPSFHILDPEQTEDLDESKVLTTCSLYSGESLLMPQRDVDQQLQEPDDEETPETQNERDSVIVKARENIAVTDEQGNPLHFTMQDGTRLAITSSDGKSLQVITQDGQTIPVEINGYTEEEVRNSDTVVHQLNLQKSVDASTSSPVTHFYALV